VYRANSLPEKREKKRWIKSNCGPRFVWGEGGLLSRMSEKMKNEKNIQFIKRSTQRGEVTVKAQGRSMKVRWKGSWSFKGNNKFGSEKTEKIVKRR